MQSSSINQKDQKETEEKDTSDEGKRKKKKVAKQVKNPNPNSAWKTCMNEKWDTVFKNKTKDGPVLSCGVLGCLKYHGKMFCYDDCRWKASHCVLTGEDESKLDKYIKELRGE